MGINIILEFKLIKSIIWPDLIFFFSLLKIDFKLNQFWFFKWKNQFSNWLNCSLNHKILNKINLIEKNLD